MSDFGQEQIFLKRNKKYKDELTPDERYQINYERGYREGKLEAIRDNLLNILKIKGKEQNYKISDDLIKKIRYETDYGYLSKFIFTAIKDDISIQYIEEKYEEIFRSEEDIISEKHTIYKKYDESK